MLSQTLPPSAAEYAAEQRAIGAAAVADVLRLWRRMGYDFDTSWARLSPRLLAVTMDAQERMARSAQEYIPDVLEDTGQTRAIRPAATARTSGLVGLAGDGRPVDSLLYGAVTRAKSLVGGGTPPSLALGRASKWLTMTTGTVLSDTARHSESLGIGLRPVGGYVRMLQVPSCSRCVLLAGRRYKSSVPFLRHPRCDCRHIPASESVAGDLTVDPASYFESLSKAEQDATFTQAGAEAIRSGADIGQVVNARRGMQAAQIGGRSLLVTTEGTTRRGRARAALSGRPRLMPETIAAVAADRADYLRLLYANGYIN